MIKERILADITVAQKAVDAPRLGALRMLSSAIQSREIEKRGKGETAPLTDEEITAVLVKEAKKRTEAIALYAQGGREDLKKKEEAELEIIYAYMPRPISREEVEKVVEDVIAEGNPRTERAEQSSYDGNPRTERAEQSSHDGNPRTERAEQSSYDGKRDFPSVMKEVSLRLKGKADGRMVAEIVKAKLGV